MRTAVVSWKAGVAVGVRSLDHLVLTVADIELSVAIYTSLLGMERVTFGNSRTAIRFGDQRINLHGPGEPILPRATAPTPGSADLCFLVDVPLEDVVSHLTTLGIALESGIVKRKGAAGLLRSVYLRDPDGNLIELSNRVMHLPKH